MKRLRLVLGDQLSRDLASLRGLDAAADVVLMVEVAEETTYVPHHRQKIALILAAMRHFAAALEEEGVTVDYVRLDAPGNSGSFGGEVARAIERHRPDSLVLTEPGEWRVRAMMEDWRETLGLPVTILEDDRFLASHADFERFAEGRTLFRMEHFYRRMRRQTGFLMEGDEPAGGRWNFDAENRKRLPKGYRPPQRLRFAPDARTREVLALVESRFAHHIGSHEGFGWPVTRAQALAALDHFVTQVLPAFGDFQDAMQTGEPFLHHSLLSSSLNLGLLSAREVCERAEAAWRAGGVPLNAVEGFIRQILGWREYVRGIYWARMPDYALTNALGAARPLPDFYWTGETSMACMAAAIGETIANGYAHHIQRLMVTGNFALLAGISPAEIEEWYLAVYVDAYDWVELPNTHGMVMFADGGLLASKPYAASGAYINRMSDYCAGCAYDVKRRTGSGACPFNHLYWSFLIRNRPRLEHNQRMAMPYRNLDAMGAHERETIRAESEAFLDGLEASGRWRGAAGA